MASMAPFTSAPSPQDPRPIRNPGSGSRIIINGDVVIQLPTLQTSSGLQSPLSSPARAVQAPIEVTASPAGHSRGPIQIPTHNTRIPTASTLPPGAHQSGPYIHANNATNAPTTADLMGIRVPRFDKLKVTQYLLDRRQATNDNNEADADDQWRTYMCSAIVRHFGYNKFVTPMSMSVKDAKLRRQHRVAYNYFMQEFMSTIQIADRGCPMPDRRKTELVEMEVELTHLTFGCFPALFDITFATNGKLLANIDHVAPSFEFLCTLGYPISFDLVETLRKGLMEHWINLDVPIDVLSGDDPRYHEYLRLHGRMQVKLHELVVWGYEVLRLEYQKNLRALSRTDDQERTLNSRRTQADGKENVEPIVAIGGEVRQERRGRYMPRLENARIWTRFMR